LPTSELPDAPRLGDIVLDAAGRRWTILTVKRATLGARWRCETRNLAIAAGLDDSIAIQKNVGTTASPIWQTWKTGLRARIQPLRTIIDNDAEAPTTTTKYRIFVEENIEVAHTCRIRGPNGTIYTVTGAIGAEQIGELQVIEAEVK
jgi:hypothetical protein